MKKKATVLEIRDGHAALLREDGIFVKQRNRGYKIGDVVMLEEQSFWAKRKIVASIAAMMLVTFLSGGMVAYARPSYYVSIDSNPSILLEVNMFERVLKAEALDPAAVDVLEGLKLENMNVEQAVDEAVGRMSEMGYLQSSENNVLVTATAENQVKAEKLVEKLEKSVAKEIVESNSEAQVTVNVVSYDMVDAAKTVEGMTPGKYNIVVNQLGKDPKDYVDVSIQEIMNEIKDAKEAAKEDQKQPNDSEDPEKPETPEKPEKPEQPEPPEKPTPPGQENKPEKPQTKTP